MKGLSALITDYHKMADFLSKLAVIVDRADRRELSFVRAIPGLHSLTSSVKSDKELRRLLMPACKRCWDTGRCVEQGEVTKCVCQGE